MIPSVRLRRNVSANLVGAGITALAALVSAPLMFRWLGAGAYGLIGVYVLLQTLMPLFDLGLTAGLARAIAWHRGRNDAGGIVTLLALAQKPMLLMALVLALALSLGSGPIAQHWLNSVQLPEATVRVGLIVMGVALSIRMLAALGRAALIALEHQVEANAVQAGAALARTFGALGVALATETGIIGFLTCQIPVSALEWWAYRRALSRILPERATPVDRLDLIRHLRFAAGIGVLAALWLVTSQVDKLALSRVLSLRDYGAYSLGVHVAAVLIMVVGTVHGAMLPRLTALLAGGREDEGRLLYGMATGLTVAVSAGVAVGIALFGESFLPLLGAESTGVDLVSVAVLYAIGNGGVAILALAYQLQNARGKLRLHAVGTLLQCLVQVPVLLVVAATGSTVATALAFALVNWVFVALWLPWVHGRHLAGGHVAWLKRDLLPPLVTAVVIGGGCIAGAVHIHGRHALALFAMLGTATTMLAVLAAHTDLRSYVRAQARIWMASHGH